MLDTSHRGYDRDMPRDSVDWFEVIAKIEAGDRAAFLRLTGLVATILARIGAYPDSSSREDLVQDVTLSLLSSVRKQTIKDPSRFVGYAWAVVRNRWITESGSRSRRAAKEHDWGDLENLAETEARPLERTADPGMRVDLERALGSLLPPERQVLDAIYLQGLSYAETCERLGMPLGSVKRNQWRGLRALREWLGIAARRS